MTASINELHYLKSILGNLREFHKYIGEKHYGLGVEILADNIDWLDCYIDKKQRAEPERTLEGRDELRP